MKPRTNMRARSQKTENAIGEGPNWILVAGSALLGSLFIHLGHKLKQALEARQPESATLKGNGKSADRRPGTRHSHPTIFTYGTVEESFFNCNSGTEVKTEKKNPPNGQILTEPEGSLSLVTIPAPVYSQGNGAFWASSPERLELPPKPFNHSNCSESPCASDSGSDVFSKREVIQKLRQHLKRRDDMILEMQDQITALQNAINSQASHANHLQSQLDTTNRELFDSEREIQRLRKAISDHCVGNAEPYEKNLPTPTLLSEENNGHVNGYDGDWHLKMSDKCKGNGGKIEMLKREIGELKEVIDGKEFLVQSYKEQKSELCIKIRELQQRLDSQVPNIL